ncbi:MAG: hypothetical protein SOW84_00660 [Candidatus Faecousia sp.]|nr:hypothetical protein [Candidatus Faecousia sp.]
MTDRAFCFCLVLAELMVSTVVISPDDSEDVVLAKVMKAAKEIRPGDKKRVKTCVKTPINRRSGWVPGGCLPFWGPEMQGGRARRRGDGLPVMSAAGNVPAAICGGNSAVFNQPLTTFLVVAMVWRLAVFVLCSYWQSRRLWRLFRSPGAWAVLGGLRGGLGV